MQKDLVVLVDTNNTLYRMYHTQPPREKGGVRVESAIGVINEIRQLSKGTLLGVPKQVIAMFDANGKNFRHELSPIYKQERKGMDPELKVQESLAKDALTALGISVIEKEGVEADDSMGMVAHYFLNKGYDVLIVTIDKDMTQLIEDGITIYNPITKKLIDREAVIAKFGVPPEKMAEYLALMGDSNDGIPGVPSIGIKTAAKLLNEKGSISAIIDGAQDVKGVVGENLRAFVGNLDLNLKLTTIVKDPLELTDDELFIINEPKVDPVQCKQMASKYGFNMDLIVGKPLITAPVVQKESKTKKAIVEDSGPSQGSLF